MGVPRGIFGSRDDRDGLKVREFCQQGHGAAKDLGCGFGIRQQQDEGAISGDLLRQGPN